jgi:hypothetical protein
MAWVLGSSDFVERLLAEADEKEKGRLRFPGKVGDLGILARRISKGEEIEESALRSGRRQRKRKISGEVGISGSEGDAFPWGDDIGGGPGSLF